ncbi:hypothetical protein BD289DRAFT_461500 [Coniella lustricola]|uniref:Mucoidy inhibitor A n=1 Tax=Coniella lustricola TaxID=2025994 RepID=A0A2T3A528_9PEZI|nr:hypothetical protein BD289DRAFT_461500 [Coniella lustricola]
MSQNEKQEFCLRDLPTRTVTLFPTRAQVVRDLKDVLLKPGLNRITISGLTPTADPNTIKVEGAGSALITDISVELLPNSELFEDLYPVLEDDNADEEAEESDGSINTAADSATIIELNSKLHNVQQEMLTLSDDLKRAKESVSNADGRLKMLEGFSANIEPKSGADIGDIVSTYREQRNIIFDDYMVGSTRQRELEKELHVLKESATNLEKQLRQEKSKANKAQREAEKAKRKQKDLEAKRNAQKHEQQVRQRSEQSLFWPKKCYAVTVTIDNSEYTPVSSRRSSAASAVDLMKPVPEQIDSPVQSNLGFHKLSMCDIALSYVTSSASWSPCYDIQLSTTSNTATVLFDARLSNATSETWKDCKVVLSTSQADFSGLSASIPKLVPWRICLGRQKSSTENAKDIAYSNEERKARLTAQTTNKVAGVDLLDRATLFGLPKEAVQRDVKPNPFPAQDDGSSAPSPFNSTGPGVSKSSFAPPPRSSGLFYCAAPVAVPRHGGAIAAFGSVSVPAVRHQAFASPPHQDNTAFGVSYNPSTSAQGENESDDRAVLDFPESEMEEKGLTTTYDMPGARTLVPSFTPCKQRVARISLSKVDFTRIVVAKLRPAAFLTARLHNTSKLSLLKGPAGLTLDGAFLGRSSVPNCWPGDSFSLSLGVDPTIRVLYPKADVKRSTSGVFSKEDSTIYTRSITLTNTRADGGGKPIQLTVQDQIPVSEDERLKVTLLHPRGLARGGAEVATGAQCGRLKDGKEWGRAVATMKDDGQVSWDVTLQAGRGAKLTLDYEVSLPAGEQAVQNQSHTSV